MRLLISFLIFGIIFSCGQKEKTKGKPTELPEFVLEERKAEFQYYDAEFELDSTSKIRTDGYYEVTQIFGTYTTDLETYHTNKPKFGFVHFFNDGFCRVCSWNGIRKNPQDVEIAFEEGKGYVFNGMYKIVQDTVKIEYLYNPASPGAGQTDNRKTLIGVIKDNRINFISYGQTKYSYPNNPSDSLTSSCIGRFKLAEFDQSQWNNYLKENITKYIKTE